MSLGGLRNFLSGGEVRPDTLRKLQGWYVRSRAELGQGASADAIRAALALILEPEVLDAVERACMKDGAPVPDWVQAMREGWKRLGFMRRRAPSNAEGRMELKFAMLADAVNISQEGKLNITGVFDSIWADRTPATHPSLHLVARFEARVSEGTQHQVQVGFFDEDGQPLLSMSPMFPLEFQINGPGRPLRSHVVAHFTSLQLPRFGAYEFHILINGRHEASVPLYVHPMSAVPDASR